MVSLYISICICVVNIVLWFLFFQKFKKTYSPEKVLTSIRIEVDKLLKEIMREAEIDVILVEARIQGLKELIAQADERILCAEREVSKRNYEKKVLSNLHDPDTEKEIKTADHRKLRQYISKSIKPPIDPVLIDSSMQNELIVADSRDAIQPAVQYEHPIAVSQVQMPPVVVEEYPDIEVVVSQAVFEMQQPEIIKAKEQIQPKQSARDRVIELYNMNFSAEIISDKLKLPLSEVQVVINMFIARK